MAMRKVRVPDELLTAPQRPLEEYVRARILQFAPAFAGRITPNLNPSIVQQAAVDAIQSLPPADYSGATLDARDMQLVFRHDCLSLGCLDCQCVLCEHNPHRRCSVNFANKYLVNDVLKAKCDAPIRVEVIDRRTGQPVAEDIPELAIEMFIVDGNNYDQKCLESGDSGEEESMVADTCALLLNNKASALLVSASGASHTPDNKITVSLHKGVAILPDIHISDSSEALLSGRKPPFRLVVRAVQGGNKVSSIRQAVSEGFVVATRRTRTAGKVEIPNVDDHISKLEHMGKETVRKLQDIRGSSQQVGIELQVPDNCINKVGEFRKLALLAEADGHLRQKLQQVLKLSKEKWDEARDHAMRAVVADNRMRIWYADTSSMELGLLFTCRLGKIDLDRPVGLLTKKSQEGQPTMMEATLMAQQTPTQREQVRFLQPQAEAAWWSNGHPGWAIHPIDSDQFLAAGALDIVSVPTDMSGLTTIPSGSPLAPSSPVMAGGTLPAFNPALASAFMGGLSNDVLMRAMAPFMQASGSFLPGAMPPGAVSQGFVPPDSLMAASPASHPGGLEAAAGDADGAAAAAEAGDGGTAVTTSPFANHSPPGTLPRTHSQGLGVPHGRTVSTALPPIAPFPGKSGNMDGVPSFNLGNLGSLQAMLNDASRLPLNLQGFPSIPAAGMLGGMLESGDLEHLLAQPQHTDALIPGGRLPSLNFGTVNSLELPEVPALNTGLKPGSAGSGGRRVEGSNVLQRRNSGLESMESIEQALAGVRTVKGEKEQQSNDFHAAMDAAAQEHRMQQQLSGSKRK